MVRLLRSFALAVSGFAIAFSLPSWVFCAQRAQQSSDSVVGPVAFRSIEEVVLLWLPEQQLYIHGNIGVGRQQLIELHKWLSANGPHWTIVLMEQASDQSYTANDGRDYVGMDAVEHALGYGLSNQTDFGRLEHPLTKETDGAIFVLFLKERKFSYFASDAQDRRGLGQANWIGELDQPAFRAMRGGGRILDAVKDTVKLVNQRLERAIAAEADATRRAERERQRASDELRMALAATRQSTAEVEREAAAFRQQYPQAAGPLANPPVNQWRKKFDELEAQIKPDEVRSLEQKLSVVSDTVAQFLNAYAALKSVNEQADRLQQHALRLQVAPAGVAMKAALEASELIAEARQSAQEGKLDVAELLAQAEAANRQGDTAVERELERIEQTRLRALWIRSTALAMLAALLVSLAVLGWLLNRRRRSAMERALKQFADREASVRRETDNIDTLFARASDLLGSKEKIIERGYEGQTREVGEQALDYVDDLFIMSKEVRRVLEEARELVFPSNPIGLLVNLFSSSRYERAINHVTGKPLKFSRSGGLPQVLQSRLVQSPTGTIDQPQEAVQDEISMTFDEIYQAFKQRGDDAESALNTFENCLANVQDSLADLQKEFEATNEREHQLDAAARDGYFALPNYFEILIPSIQKDLAEADRLSTFDAVQAMQGSIPTAKRKIDQSRVLAEHLARARDELFPQLHSTAEKLKSLGYTSAWIDADLDAITVEANEAMKVAANRSIAEELEKVAASLAVLKAKAALSVEIAERIEQQLLPGLRSLENRITDARHDLSLRMQLPTESILHELDRDPDDYLERGRKNLEAAKTMLQQGRTEAALLAIDTANTETSRADSVIVDSMAAVQAFNEKQQASNAQLQSLRTRVPQLQTEIASASQAYASPALLVPVPAQTLHDDSSRMDHTTELSVPQDKSATNQPNSISLDHLVASAESAMRDAQRLLSQSSDEHRRGRVLQAAEIQAHADHWLATAQHKIELATAHLARLEYQSRENAAEQQRCKEMSRTLLKAHDDALVTQPTLAAITQLASNVEQNSRDIESARSAPNPFETGKVLLTIRQRIDELQSQIIADRQGHAEASRAVAGAERQLTVARQLVRQSQTDGIADSQQTTLANSRIATLDRDLSVMQRELHAAHGDWHSIDDRAARLQSDLTAAAKTLSGELQAAGQALQAFQQASQVVFQAEQWSGAGGIRVLGSPGVQALERARAGLETGDYGLVLEICRQAAAAAQAAISQAEREVARRRMEEQRAAEQARRAREAAMRPRINFPLGGGFSSRGSSRGSSSSSSTSRSNTSGFSRSGW